MLAGKTALVTGASRGIGKAIALELAKHGANVAVNFAGNKERAEAVANEIEEMGNQAITIRANVSDESQVKKMIKETIASFGNLDILVNNAGVTRDQLLMRMKEEDFDHVINTNLKG